MHKMQRMNVVNRRSDNMRHFCSFSYTECSKVLFGNHIVAPNVDPYDDIDEFISEFRELMRVNGYGNAILLNYKRVM